MSLCLCISCRFAVCPVTARAFVKISQPHLNVIALWYLWLISLANALFGGSFWRGTLIVALVFLRCDTMICLMP